jgi:Transposase DDE domain group 1
VKRSRKLVGVKVSGDGAGVVSHAGVALLRELAEYTGLVAGVSGALIGAYKGVPAHAPGRVFTDLAVAIADGVDAVSGIAVLGDREELFGPVASMPTAWRVLDRIDEHHLRLVRAARGEARAAAWAAGAGPDLAEWLHIDFDATITIAHREGERRGHVEAHLRLPPAAGVPGSARRFGWGGACRVAATGERRKQHRGRSHRGAGHGLGLGLRSVSRSIHTTPVNSRRLGVINKPK